ncbi:MAG: hypothetical protein KAW12_30960, partial [Candidatus Aminicenantes bacterium]|nr:hypothetical protein [Candidatus Aminicenantes bacterium]
KALNFSFSKTEHLQKIVTIQFWRNRYLRSSYSAHVPISKVFFFTLRVLDSPAAAVFAAERFIGCPRRGLLQDNNIMV